MSRIEAADHTPSILLASWFATALQVPLADLVTKACPQPSTPASLAGQDLLDALSADVEAFIDSTTLGADLSSSMRPSQDALSSTPAPPTP